MTEAKDITPVDGCNYTTVLAYGTTRDVGNYEEDKCIYTIMSTISDQNTTSTHKGHKPHTTISPAK